MINFDGLVGPTHNYAGLSFGNIASTEHGEEISNPKAAALQGLLKMELLLDLGFTQGIIPPQLRPDLYSLHDIGYSNIDEADPKLLAALSSSSSMWCANAASISASSDTVDGKVHIVPANLLTFFHRSIEPKKTARYLKEIFNGTLFTHHHPLPSTPLFADEGSANQIRLFSDERGITLFVHGKAGRLYPARQTLEATEALIRLLHLKEGQFLIAQQTAEAIDAGVFHNDVIAMGCGNLLIVHEKAYEDQEELLDNLKNLFLLTCGEELIIKEIAQEELTLQQAVKSYFFNSQLLKKSEGDYILIAPQECLETPQTNALIEMLINDPQIPLEEAHFIDIRQSMQNGGGPACLRLPAPLTEDEESSVNPNFLLTDTLLDKLTTWVENHYRDHLSPNDLQDPKLHKECQEALHELSSLLK